jgi:hypothetical protein
MRLLVGVAGLAAVFALLPLVGVDGARGSSTTAAGRQSRDSGIAIAGGNVYVWSAHQPEQSGGGCTVAFAVRSRQTSQLGVLTAGHCVRTLSGGPAYLVHQTQRLNSSGTEPGDLLGRVEHLGSRLGKNGDNAFVRLVAHRLARPLVFIGSVFTSSTIPVAGSVPLRAGLSVCYSGAASGEHCGFKVVGGPQTVVFSDHGRVVHIKHEWRATRSSCPSRRGDSGSPVYVRRDGKAYAVGILSGGQTTPGRCPFFFTPVQLALRSLDLKLLTATPVS